MVRYSDTILYTKETEKFITEGIAEFFFPGRNNPSRTAVPHEDEVQLFGNSGSSFIWDGYHFCPLAEVILDTYNIFVPSALRHLHQVN